MSLPKRLACSLLMLCFFQCPNRGEATDSAKAIPEVPPWLQRIVDVLRGVRARPPARTGETQYDWSWVAARYDADHDGVITPREFGQPPDVFARLDRRRDGKLTREDFDWSPQSLLSEQAVIARQVFREIDRTSNGRITAEEWQAAFARLANGKGYVSDEDLRQFLYPPPEPRAPGPRQSSDTLLGRLERLKTMAERGTLFQDGVSVGSLAPDFALRSPDGSRVIRLSQYRGIKPVVLVFGSFT